MITVLIIDLILLAMITVVACAVVQISDLFSAVMLAGLYSLFMALVWSNMRALDVAFTEAAVGAGISTVLLLGALVWTGRYAKPRPFNIQALLMVLLTGAVLVYGTLDMPGFGDPNAPIHRHRVPKIAAQTVGKVPGSATAYDIHAPDFGAHSHHLAHPVDEFGGHVPNTVTSLLAAYRGFDTMFETTVIFVAGISLILLLRRREYDEQLPKTQHKRTSRRQP